VEMEVWKIELTREVENDTSVNDSLQVSVWAMYICVHMMYICKSVKTNKQYPVDCSLSRPCHVLVVGHEHL